VQVLKYDLAKEPTYFQLLMNGHTDIDAIIHLAAESHVDRSIQDGMPFIMSNIVGTGRLLEFAKEYLPDLKIFLNFCTDEILGSRTSLEGKYKIGDPKRVRNVYAASKSCQEELGFGYSITHKIPVITTRCTNVFGPKQYPEKFLPVIITKLINKEKIPVYGQGLQEREWVFVEDVIKALIGVLKHVTDKGIDSTKAHENIYHIGGERTYANIDFMKKVIDLFCQLNGNERSTNYDQYFKFVEDRKGHDFRYDLDCSSTHDLGLKPMTSLEEGLEKTIKWYLEFYAENPNGWD
jgi:dTDP-glucose 4,6-dehydratase